MDALPIGIDPIKIAPVNGGWDWLYQFDNGYGASVILNHGSYGNEEGLFELLLAKFAIKGSPLWNRPDDAFIESMEDSEPGGDDVGLYGWLTLTDVARILGAVRGYDNPVTLAIRNHVMDTRDTRTVTMITHDGVWRGSTWGSW